MALASRAWCSRVARSSQPFSSTSSDSLGSRKVSASRNVSSAISGIAKVSDLQPLRATLVASDFAVASKLSPTPASPPPRRAETPCCADGPRTPAPSPGGRGLERTAARPSFWRSRVRVDCPGAASPLQPAGYSFLLPLREKVGGAAARMRGLSGTNRRTWCGGCIPLIRLAARATFSHEGRRTRVASGVPLKPPVSGSPSDCRRSPASPPRPRSGCARRRRGWRSAARFR